MSRDNPSHPHPTPPWRRPPPLQPPTPSPKKTDLNTAVSRISFPLQEVEDRLTSYRVPVSKTHQTTAVFLSSVPLRDDVARLTSGACPKRVRIPPTSLSPSIVNFQKVERRKKTKKTVPPNIETGCLVINAASTKVPPCSSSSFTHLSQRSSVSCRALPPSLPPAPLSPAHRPHPPPVNINITNQPSLYDPALP